MATVIEQENEISLNEGEEFGSLEELMAPAAEAETAKQEPTPDVSEPEDDLDIPEKVRGKGIKDIVKSYVSLEQEYGRKNNEIGELRKLADEIIKQNLELNNGGIPASKKSIGVDDLLDDPEKAISSALENHDELFSLLMSSDNIFHIPIDQSQERFTGFAQIDKRLNDPAKVWDIRKHVFEFFFGTITCF